MFHCKRCNQEFEPDHILDVVCNSCFKKNPKYTTEEKKEMNLWDQLDDFLVVYKAMKENRWSWAMNMDCKYVTLNIDMRDGGCIIMNKQGQRIGPDALAWQYSDETPDKPNT